MNKKIYQSPCAYAIEIIGKAILSASDVRIGGTSEKVDNSNDIGFVKEQNWQSGNVNIWDNEW